MTTSMSATMRIPFLDLRAQYATIAEEIDAAIAGVVHRADFILGEDVAAFESEFAEYLGVKAVVGVASGLAALELALRAYDIGPGDEVITPANTFIATVLSIVAVGAKPVLVDMDPKTHNIDPDAIEAAVTSRTRVIMPVHLYGQPANLDPILAIARKHNLLVIEDAAQAHGSRYNGRRIGGFGHAAAFSFYPGKNLGAFGEAGAIVTNNLEVRDKIRTLRDHGQVRKYHHSMIGWNCRMDGIQAAVLRVKLKHLDQGNDLRRQHAQRYGAELRGIDGIVTPREASYARHIYHVYALRVQERDELMSILRQRGIQTAIHYPVPIHLQPAYEMLGHENGDFPLSEQMAREFISLPMFPELTNLQIDFVAKAVKEALSAAAVA